MSHLTNFEKVTQFNRNFGVLKPGPITPNPQFLKTNAKETQLCLALIREEMKELSDAVNNDDYIETVDALTDILYVVYGMGCRIGVDMDKAFDLVHENNMSKLCETEDDAIKTVRYYEANKDKLGYDSPTYKKAPDDVHWVVFNKSTNKILKSCWWKPVDLSPVCTNQ